VKTSEQGAGGGKATARKNAVCTSTNNRYHKKQKNNILKYFSL
jgi:hypothetical protein